MCFVITTLPSTSNLTDWLMVIVTTIYVIATIIICISNYKSAKASREMLYQNEQTQIQNIKINLFNQRMDVYNHCKNVVESAHNDPSTLIPVLEKYDLLNKASFLFDSDISSYINDMLKKSDEFCKLHVSHERDNNEKKINDSRYMELLYYFRKQATTELSEHFKKYFDINNK